MLSSRMARVVCTSAVVVLMLLLARSGEANDLSDGSQGADLSGLLSLFGGLSGGDGCQHTCENGDTPKARKGHKPRSNGCGTDFFRVDVSDFPKLTECCNQHDVCYDTCHKGTDGRTDCDDDFKKCMKKKCKKHYNKKEKAVKRKGDEDKDRMTCSATADMMYGGVVALGCGAYRDSQRDACTCKKQSRNQL